MNAARENITIHLYALSTTSNDETTGQATTAIQQLFLDDYQLTTDSYIFDFNLTELDSESSIIQAMRNALSVIQFENELYNPSRKELVFPLILGCPWSSLSAVSVPTLGGFNFGQISSSTTSTYLSDSGTYPYLSNLSPNDDYQAQGIMYLCQRFNWTRIGVMYVSDFYGVYLATNVLSLSLELGIEAYSVSFDQVDTATHENAAKAVKSMNVFVIVLITHGNVLDSLYGYLDDQDLIGYPYYYIGDSAWFDESDIDSINSNNDSLPYIFDGYIGLVPWQANKLSLETLDTDTEYDFEEISMTASKIANNVSQVWDIGYENNPSSMYYLKYPTNWVNYAWDSMLVLMHTIERYDDIYGMDSVWDSSNENYLNEDQGELMARLDNILHNISNESPFIGATGEISFDSNGQRLGGIYTFGNYLGGEEGINCFGWYYYDQGSENYTFVINESAIIWPQDFIDQDIIPRTEQMTTVEVTTINASIFAVFMFFIVVSIILAIALLFFTLILSKNPAIHKINYQLNVIGLIGIIFLYHAILLYGFDERDEDSNVNLDLACNARIWLATVGYTLFFLPFSWKMYEISRIFDGKVFHKSSNFTIFLIIVICLVADIVLLSIFAVSGFEFKRSIVDGDITVKNALQAVQEKYGICTTGTDLVFDVIVGLWKLSQLIFGAYCAIIVARSVKLEEIAKLDETGIQIVSLLFSCFVTVIVGIAVTFVPPNNVQVLFLLVALLVIIVGNIMLIGNVLPRVWAVLLHKENELFPQTPQEIWTEKWIKTMHRAAKRFAKERLSKRASHTGTSMAQSIALSEKSSNGKQYRSTTKLFKISTASSNATEDQQ